MKLLLAGVKREGHGDKQLRRNVRSRRENVSEQGVLLQIFSLPHNNPDSSEGYYSFDYGDAHFVCLAYTNVPYSAGSTQYNWLVNDLRSSKAKFKIVFMHIPPYSSGNHGRDANVLDVRNVLCPVFEQNKVNIVFSGHDHDYERSVPINGTIYIVAGGGGAPLYNPATSNPWTAYKEMAFSFCKVEVDSATCRVTMIRSDGAVKDSLVLRAGGAATGIVDAQNKGLPKGFSLFQNYPNPFNPGTIFRYELPKDAHVSLTIFNTLGQIVATVVNESRVAGYYEIYWNATVPSGIYFYRMQTEGFVETRKMILLR